MFALPLLAVLVQTLSGSAVDALASPPGTKAIVFLFTSTDCPISNRYSPDILGLADKYRQQGIVFRLIYPGRIDSPKAIHDHMSSFGYAGKLEAFRDPNLALAHFVGATVTPEAAVVVHGAVAYHGRIDDRFPDIGIERATATTHDLADALQAIVEGRVVTHPVTHAFGCYISDLAR